MCLLRDSLFELDLSNAFIGLAGALCIAKHLVPNVAEVSMEVLGSLRLAGNSMGDKGLAAISESLRVRI